MLQLFITSTIWVDLVQYNVIPTLKVFGSCVLAIEFYYRQHIFQGSWILRQISWADYQNTEWEIRPDVYRRFIVRNFGQPVIDLFASNMNKKCERYVSWRKDAKAFAIDAFTLNWSSLKGLKFVFPPFSLLGMVAKKIRAESCENIVIVYPEWTVQSWYPNLVQLLKREPVQLPVQPFTKDHPLGRKLRLQCGLI